MTQALHLYQGPFGRVCLVRSDGGLVNHAHPQCHVVIKASGADSVFRVRGRHYVLDDDTMILVNAWEPHSKIQRSGDGPSVVLALFLEPLWLSSRYPQLAASGLPGFFPSPHAVLPTRIRELADRLITRTYEPDNIVAGRATWENALLELMMAIARACSEHCRRKPSSYRTTQRATDSRITRAIHFMKDNLGVSLSSEELARMHCLSRPHFFSLFRKCTALSPALYMNTLRVEAALGFLADDGVSIGQLSDRLGFSMPHHFTRFFRHNVGISPTEYRRAVTVVADRPANSRQADEGLRPDRFRSVLPKDDRLAHRQTFRTDTEADAWLPL